MQLPPVSAVFAIGASFCFGLQAVVVKDGIDRVDQRGVDTPAIAAAFVTIVISVTVFWGLVLFRGLPETELSLGHVLPFAVAGVAYPALYRYLYFAGIDRVGASVAASISAASPAVAAVLAIVLLGERATPAIALGIVLIVAGGVLLQYARQAGQEESADGLDVVVSDLTSADTRDLLYPVTGMVTLGGAYVLIKFAMTQFPHPVMATALTQTAALSAFGIGLLTSPSSSRRIRATVAQTDALAAFVVAGLLAALGWLGQFVALSLGTVVVVVPLVSTYPLFVVLFSYGLARERPRSPTVLLAIVTIVIGASLLEIV
jgi:drug/metabolite transporter (DMT)-like permease